MAVLSLLLLMVCIGDYRNHRIPNVLILFIFSAGLTYRCRHGGVMGLTGYFQTGVIVLLLSYPLFKIGTMGAGDVKLFAVTSGYLSGKAVICFLIYSLLIAGFFSIIKLLKEQNGQERFHYSCSYMAEVLRTRKWRLYFRNEAGNRQAGICLSGPVFLSILLYLGGVY